MSNEATVGQVESFYTALAFALNAKVIVELGTGSGMSAQAFLNALRYTGGVLYSVDLYPEEHTVKETRSRFKDEKQIVFITGDSIEVGKTWDKGKVDIVLCDSDHAKDRVLGELEVWNQYQPKIFLIHDILYQSPTPHLAPPYEACVEFAQKHNRKFIYFDIPNTPSFGIII